MTEDSKLGDRLRDLAEYLEMAPDHDDEVATVYETTRELASLRGRVEELTRLREEDLLAFEATQMKRDEQNLKLQAKVEELTLELGLLQADFNDCNSERARWKSRAETAEANIEELEEENRRMYHALVYE